MKKMKDRFEKSKNILNGDRKNLKCYTLCYTKCEYEHLKLENMSEVDLWEDLISRN